MHILSYIKKAKGIWQKLCKIYVAAFSTVIFQLKYQL